MKNYHWLLEQILLYGEPQMDRTGVGAKSLFGHQLRFDLSEGFPLLTTKRVHLRAILVELVWFLRGDTNIAFLHEHEVKIWDEWADSNGDLGPVYGKQWRSWSVKQCRNCNGRGSFNDAHEGDIGWNSWACEDCSGKGHHVLDQIAIVIDGLKRNPYGRRHIVTAWNPAEVDAMALPPCHCLFQFHVRRARPAELDRWAEDEYQNELIRSTGRQSKPVLALDCQLYQRSGDMFLGVPFNIASYSALVHVIAHSVGMLPGEFIHTFGNAHIYLNHLDQVTELLSRDHRPLPRLAFDPLTPRDGSLKDLKPTDFALVNYNPHPAIKAPVAV